MRDASILFGSTGREEEEEERDDRCHAEAGKGSCSLLPDDDTRRGLIHGIKH